MSFDPRHVTRSPPIIAIVIIPIMVKLLEPICFALNTIG